MKQLADKVMKNADVIHNMGQSPAKKAKATIDVPQDTIDNLKDEASRNPDIVLEVVAGTLPVPAANAPKGTAIDPNGGSKFDLKITTARIPEGN